MHRSTRRAAAALTASAALLLTACGGSDDNKDNDKIAGADAGSEKSASPSASADGVDRPEIKLPSDVKLTFTPERAGDPVKDAVLRDNADMIRALNMAIVAGDPQLPALEYYTEGEGAVAARDWVKSFKDAGWTVTGTVRYFDRNVKVKSKDSAAIGYCADESKGFTKDVKTDEIKRTRVTKDSYVAYSAQLRKNEQGVWELMKMASTRGATGCQP
ncbi:hypothetical protein ACOBQB_27845 [Streptomyces sp. G5(2025)]|uniref:hypothetical protein n=1 Tax=Streptomyces sp. G5(2025) TaxID=3406628 RepID=UPI003C17F675